jgi:hypothetical protein
MGADAMFRRPILFRLIAGAAALAATAAGAQMRTVDPNAALRDPPRAADQGYVEPVPVDERDPAPAPAPAESGAVAAAGNTAPRSPASGQAGGRLADPSDTFQDDDVFAAAEGVFGKGAEGLAKLLEKVLKDQGRPTAYIAGREGGGAFAVGVRYGSGTMHHKVEGELPVYWTGPSVGLDIGANGSKTFVLVYNLYDTGELFHRFPSGEAAAYAIGGFTASYLRRGDTVLIPIRLGVGWRLGANVGYMRFSRESKWLPF